MKAIESSRRIISNTYDPVRGPGRQTSAWGHAGGVPLPMLGQLTDGSAAMAMADHWEQENSDQTALGREKYISCIRPDTEREWPGEHDAAHSYRFGGRSMDRKQFVRDLPSDERRHAATPWR